MSMISKILVFFLWLSPPTPPANYHIVLKSVFQFFFVVAVTKRPYQKQVCQCFNLGEGLESESTLFGMNGTWARMNQIQHGYGYVCRSGRQSLHCQSYKGEAY